MKSLIEIVVLVVVVFVMSVFDSLTLFTASIYSLLMRSE